MPRKSKKSQAASQRWQRVHDIDFVSTGQADGVPQSNGEVKRSEVSDAVKQGGENASCQPRVSYEDVLKRRRVSESPAAGPSNSEQVKHRGESNDPGVQQVTYADMLKRKLPRVSRTAGPSNSPQVNYIAQTDKPFSTQVSYPDTVNHRNYQSVSASSQAGNINQSGEQNVCASRSQASLKYGRSRNQQCTCNSLTFLAFLNEKEHITRADLDRVLDKGDAMYREIRKTVDHAHLTTDELPDQVPARRHMLTVDKLQLSRYAASCTYELKPVVFCDVNPSDAIPATESPSTSPSVTTTVINDDTSAPQMNADVHENTEWDMETEPEPLIDFNQCSVTLTGPEFLTPEINTTVSDGTSQKASTLMETQAHQPGEINNNSVTLEETQQTKSNLTQPLITIPIASDKVIHDISTKLSKLSKQQKKKFKRRLMRSGKTSQKKENQKRRERQKYAKSETYKAKKKSYSSNKYSVNPEIRTKKRQKITSKYRESTGFRLKQKEYITKKYRENVDFKGRQKEYITKKYRENVDFKGRQKLYFRKNMEKMLILKADEKNISRKNTEKMLILKADKKNISGKNTRRMLISGKDSDHISLIDMQMMKYSVTDTDS
ncbi:uncharacterized protein LOC117832690 isoform X1 [Xyrichtys novacula]|uniref:Uncharacterized protein LOC117832690 isoform X1 n=1 Tax=Xyrichtys novacula TaxID=13765 RepID=A0AAV1FND6_XYRNO|nr:uncharacterized protein LOC117832690 isoform X1 [Xyrichtys novacula]